MKTIEIRTKALGTGTWRNGAWEPAGQLLATLTVDTSSEMTEQIMDRLRRAAPAVGTLEAEEEWAVELLEE